MELAVVMTDDDLEHAGEIRVLLVEDEPEQVDRVKEAVSKIGAEIGIEAASSLKAATERLEAGGIDVVLLDLNLPDSKGALTFHKTHDAFPEYLLWCFQVEWEIAWRCILSSTVRRIVLSNQM